MAPFLDQSLDPADNTRNNERGPLPKQPSSKDKSRQDPSAALTADQGRPRTSTGMRGNGIFHKIGGTSEEVPGAAHSILHPQ